MARGHPGATWLRRAPRTRAAPPRPTTKPQAALSKRKQIRLNRILTRTSFFHSLLFFIKEEMIVAAIAAHPEDARQGISRPTIKKYLHAKYPDTQKVPEASFNNHIAKAIAKGAETKVFSLPKGISGRVKMAPKDQQPKPAKKAAAPKKPAAAKKTPSTKAKKPAAATKVSLCAERWRVKPARTPRSHARASYLLHLPLRPPRRRPSRRLPPRQRSPPLRRLPPPSPQQSPR